MAHTQGISDREHAIRSLLLLLLIIGSSALGSVLLAIWVAHIMG